VSHRIQKIVLKLTADTLRALENDEEKILKKSVELHKQIAGDLPRELGILAKLVELTALMIYYGCLGSGIAEDSQGQELCRNLAISTVLVVCRIAKMEVLEHLEDFPKKINRNEVPIHI